MTDRVEKFIDEFGAALDLHRRRSRNVDLIDTAVREVARLATTLERLAESEERPRSMTSADLRSLQEELTSLQQPAPLALLVTKGRALLQVLDDGIIDGDADRLRQLLSEAGSISDPSKRRLQRGAGRQIRLQTPAKARCVECNVLVVGSRDATLDWNGITLGIRKHERNKHGLYTSALRDELTNGLKGLRSGTAIVVAGRYEIGQL